MVRTNDYNTKTRLTSWFDYRWNGSSRDGHTDGLFRVVDVILFVDSLDIWWAVV